MVELFQKKNQTLPAYSRINLREGNFSENPFKSNSPFDLILLDLGLSSLHLENLDRGMSYRKNNLLDMRFNQTEGIPVHQWLNHASEKEIADVLFQYGEERLSRRIASLIVYQRVKQKIDHVADLKEICRKAYLRIRKLNYKRHTTRHPYIRSLQALRIFINQELRHLEFALSFLPTLLKKGGYLFIISFHSLEDRIVKNGFKEWVSQNKEFNLVSKKPITPDEEEISSNPRCRSAKMRALRRDR